MTSLLFCIHASFYIALLFTHQILTALLMDMSDSYCRSSRLWCETSLMTSYPILMFLSSILVYTPW
ncbi:hypothetical protein J3R30DRAFT_3423041 [Lentinula aciculospora]|uniref:Uncharacterized protein n=1 Tax=Lentinula aciculospora TaxID=153920 RepID=A0A9W9DYW5_9AGAR|nr:hypothetical protein J3R30DRAFT_3423041 [Lentinula aciculospora]